MNARMLVALSLLVSVAACSGGGSSLSPSTPKSPADSAVSKQHVKPQDTLGGVGGKLGTDGDGIDILLGDAPPQIGNLVASEIDLGVDSVAVVSNGVVTPIATFSTPYVVNVMENEGQPSSIGISQYYTGTYDHIQFTFDVASSKVVAGGANYPISFLTSSALSTAGAGSTTTTTAANGAVTVTVAGNFLDGGSPASAVQADFNALESLAQNASGGIISRPALFAVPFDEAGKVDGTVLNAQGAPVSNATVAAFDANGNLGNTGITDSTGAFELRTLAAGNWHLVIYNTYTTATGQTLNASGNTSSGQVSGPSVTVTGGNTAQAGSIAD